VPDLAGTGQKHLEDRAGSRSRDVELSGDRYETANPDNCWDRSRRTPNRHSWAVAEIVPRYVYILQTRSDWRRVDVRDHPRRVIDDQGPGALRVDAPGAISHAPV
jgi:hypothetical protein